MLGGKDVNAAFKASAGKVKEVVGSDTVQAGVASAGAAAKKGASALVPFLSSAFAAIGKGLSTAGGFLGRLISQSRAALVVALVLVVLVVVGGVDLVGNWGKAYAGVHVGNVDVSGMNADQIKSALQDSYADRINHTQVTIFANEDARQYVNDSIAQAEDRAQAELLSVEQARLNNQLWTTSASELGGSIDYDKAAHDAIEVGRSDGGFGSRLAARFGGVTVNVPLSFSDDQVEHLAASVDQTIGDERFDADIVISNGYAQAFAGHDGQMVNRTAFANQIASEILSDSDDRSFVATTEPAPSRTSLEQAQELADNINRTISDGAEFSYDGASWTADAAVLGDWVETRVVKKDDGFGFLTMINTDTAKPEILKGVLAKAAKSPIEVSFTKDASDNISVTTDGNGEIPAAAAAASSLNEELFGDSGKMASGSSGSAVKVEVGSENVPTSMTLDEALESGVVTVIGTYTTEYSSYAGTESRNFNIHLAADIINNSIVKPGGDWDFNTVAGDCNEARGFQSAGTIIDGQYVDNIGGGICQVATTVFNAVFESGLDVVERHNHSLYIGSYPDGRDAAVSYPELNFTWSDDTSSDVLLQTSYTESSLTVTLYSAPTGYTVTSETGSWVEGAKYSTVTQVDESLGKGVSYTKTAGSDGKSITVTRTVKDSNGDVVKTDLFGSNYQPRNELVLKGPDD